MGAPHSIPDLRRPSCSVRPLARKAKDSDAFRGPSPSLKVSLQKIPHACRRPPLDTVAALHMRADGIAGEVVGLNRRPRTPNAQAERRRPEGRRPRRGEGVCAERDLQGIGRTGARPPITPPGPAGTVVRVCLCARRPPSFSRPRARRASALQSTCSTRRADSTGFAAATRCFRMS